MNLSCRHFKIEHVIEKNTSFLKKGKVEASTHHDKPREWWWGGGMGEIELGNIFFPRLKETSSLQKVSKVYGKSVLREKKGKASGPFGTSLEPKVNEQWLEREGRILSPSPETTGKHVPKTTIASTSASASFSASILIFARKHRRNFPIRLPVIAPNYAGKAEQWNEKRERLHYLVCVQARRTALWSRSFQISEWNSTISHARKLEGR